MSLARAGGSNLWDVPRVLGCTGTSRLVGGDFCQFALVTVMRWRHVWASSAGPAGFAFFLPLFRYLLAHGKVSMLPNGAVTVSRVPQKKGRASHECKVSNGDTSAVPCSRSSNIETWRGSRPGLSRHSVFMPVLIGDCCEAPCVIRFS